MRGIIRIYANSSLISGFYNAVKDYLQPLLIAFALSLPLFSSRSETDRSSIIIGVVYFLIFLLTSRASIYSGRFASRAGTPSAGMNLTYLAVVISGLVSGFLFHSGIVALSILFFVMVFIFENLRRPICVAKIATETDKASLSTYLSVDSQLKSMATMIISPIVGIVADIYSPGAGILAVSIILLLLIPFVAVNREK
jgi:hypothetical protein